MVQNHKLLSIIGHLNEAVGRLEEKQDLSLQDYLNNWDERDIVERELEKAVQACLDAGARMISANRWERPDDNHGIFDVLAAHKVIESDLAQATKELVGLRNVLAHEYRKIRDDEVYRHLHAAPATLRKFAAKIAKASCTARS